jgi:hypothetical protein
MKSQIMINPSSTLIVSDILPTRNTNHVQDLSDMMDACEIRT